MLSILSLLKRIYSYSYYASCCMDTFLVPICAHILYLPFYDSNYRDTRSGKCTYTYIMNYRCTVYIDIRCSHYLVRTLVSWHCRLLLGTRFGDLIIFLTLQDYISASVEVQKYFTSSKDERYQYISVDTYILNDYLRIPKRSCR